MASDETAPRSVRSVYAGGLIRVEVEEWPWGRREIVRHPGACAIVAVTGDDDVVLVSQFREPLRRRMLELPAGVFDVEGERPEECAARELLEETGFRAAGVRSLGSIHTSPGFADEAIALFIADAAPAEPPEDGIQVVRVPFADAVRLAREGEITDAKTVVGLLLAEPARRS